MLTKIWIYHKTKQPKTILVETFQANLESLKKSGWSESPEVNPEDFGLTHADNLDEISDTLKTIQTSLNQSLNIETLDQMELTAFARDGLAIKIDHLDDVEVLRDKVRAEL